MGKENDNQVSVKVIGAVSLCVGFFLCSFYLEMKAVSRNYTRETIKANKPFPANTVASCNKSIDIVLQFIGGGMNRNLQSNLRNLLVSMLSRTKCHLTLYIITDTTGKEAAEKIFEEMTSEYEINIPMVTYFNSTDILSKLPTMTRAVYRLFMSRYGSYYDRWFFYTSLGLHRFFPSTITKIIMLDIDMQFRGDVQELYAYFDRMNSSHLIGLAREQQPVYAHVNWSYRETHQGTLIGGPPPNGFTGFNSGTKLMNLEAMRGSVLYNKYIDNIHDLKSLTNKFNFKGHLGDQDFYTLLSYEHMELIYPLPCQWNRQLCEWWRKEAFENVFDFFFNCTPPYFILHGNCDTPIPDD